MVVCNNCGHQNPDGNYICSNCGFVVNQQKNKPVKPNNQRMRPVQQNTNTSQSNNQQTYQNNGVYNTQQQPTQNIGGQPGLNRNNLNINNNQQNTQNVNTTNMNMNTAPNVNKQLNYGNNYNPNNVYTQQMYQQQAYGRVQNNGNKQGKKTITIVALILVVVMLIMAVLGVRFVGKVLKNKQIAAEENKNEQVQEQNNQQNSEEQGYFSESQTIYDEHNIIVETNLADAKIENGDITLKLDISNNTNTKLNFKIQGIMVNAMAGYNNCTDIISVDANDKVSSYAFFDLDDTIQDPLYSIEFQLYIYSDDYSTIIVTDNCMFQFMNTNQPKILQAYTNPDESLVTALNANIVEESTVDNDIEEIVEQEKNYNIGNENIGYFEMNETGWKEDSRYSDSEEVTDESIEHSYSAEYIGSGVSKTLYVLNIHLLKNDLDTEYKQLCDALAIPFETKYETDDVQVMYDITYSNGTLTLTAILLDIPNEDVITIMYQEHGTERDSFMDSATNIMTSYTKCNLSNIIIE